MLRPCGEDGSLDGVASVRAQVNMLHKKCTHIHLMLITYILYKLFPYLCFVKFFEIAQLSNYIKL